MHIIVWHPFDYISIAKSLHDGKSRYGCFRTKFLMQSPIYVAICLQPTAYTHIQLYNSQLFYLHDNFVSRPIAINFCQK